MSWFQVRKEPHRCLKGHLYLLTFLFIVLVFITVSNGLAAPVSVDMARRAAMARIATDHVFKRAAESGIKFTISSVRQIELGESMAPAYAVELSPAGYLIISGDDRMRPVIAYSASSRLDLADTPENAFRALISSDLFRIAKVLRGIEAKGAEKQSPGMAAKIRAHRRRWEKILSSGVSQKSSSSSASFYEGAGDTTFAASAAIDPSDPVIGPLLGEMQWNQNNHFNELCPVDPDASSYYDGHMPTGCVATAAGQIMKYYTWPPYGTGSHSYTWNGEVLSAWFDDPFAWWLMKDSYNPWGYEPLESEMAVSELLYELGVSVEMDYSTHGSSASTDAVNSALAIYFYYQSGTSITDQTQFDQMLRQEIEAARPVLAGLLGHAVVIDGRNSSVSPATFHINYGWGGTNDGWYDLDALPDGASLREIITGITPLPLALIDKPVLEPDPDGTFTVSWHYPWYWSGSLTGFQLLEGEYVPEDFMESGDTFANWYATSGWQSVAEGHNGAGFYFPPDRRGTAVITLMDPFTPQAGAEVAFYSKVVVVDAVLNLEVSADNGRSWQTLSIVNKDNASKEWELWSESLAQFEGIPLLLRFRIDATSNPFNYYGAPYGGVWLDDIEITSCQFPEWNVADSDIPADSFSANITDKESGTYLYRVMSCTDQGCGGPSPAVTFRVEIPVLVGDFDRDGDVDGKDAAVMAGGSQGISVQDFAAMFGTVR